MISVIICSRGKSFRQNTIDSITQTIGVPYEIVAIDNSKNEYGICAAYNKGAAESSYNILCFAHEDIEFRTQNWGKVVSHILADESIGTIGATGGKWLINSPGTWWSCGNKFLSSNVIDVFSDEQPAKHTYYNPEDKPLVDVAAVDGLWLCVRKNVWQEYPFDEKTFDGFHFYDVDFCANMFHKYRVCVTMDVTIAHSSRGNFNNAWYIYANAFYRKHRHHLPLGTPQLKPKELLKQEYDWSKYFIHAIVSRKLPAQMGYSYMLKCIKIAPFSRDTFWLIRYYIKFVWQSRKTIFFAN